jgi:HAD superfamily hydrolase (TIGR01509 family)
MELLARRHWVFDLDGTLTVPVHDFDAIRAALDLPEGRPILEALDALPPAEAAPRRAHLFELEAALVEAALPQPGAVELVGLLAARGAQLGLLTRNDRRLALRTLEVIGLAPWFAADTCLGRDEAPPKPSPAGIARLLGKWQAPPRDAVMVGDYLFDLQAGRAAGVATIHVGPPEPGWSAWTDVHVTSLRGLLPEP